jgi:hypothetical protein
MPNYRFSGHETFPCRYAWLPKAFIAIDKNPRVFADEDQAMVALGVGKNMMRAIRFWVQTTGIAEATKNSEIDLTDFGKRLLAKDGLDPFLEDRRTLWLIHWKLSSHIEEPLFAWDYLLNRWSNPEISRTEVLRVFEQEARRLNRKLSTVTLAQHFDTFLHTYVPTRSRKGDVQEDNLDSPLVELELIQKIGEREAGETGRREPLYAFRREAKPDITNELFIYCLQEFWNKRLPNEKTLTFRDVAIAHGSPGQIFKLPEWEIRDRLESIEADSNGHFLYKESASLQQLTRTTAPNLFDNDLLAPIYQLEVAHA